MTLPLRLLALTMAAMLSAQACGGSKESTATLAPLIDESPTMTATTGVSEEDMVAAENAWLRTSALFLTPFTRTPFVSGDGVYAFAKLSDLKETDPSSSYTTMVLLSWEQATWTPIQQFESTCLTIPSCDISLFGAGLLTSPIITFSWCCPAGAAPIELPEASLLQIVDGKLIDFLDPSYTSSEFSVQYVNFETDTQFTVVECLESSEYYIPDIGPNGICNHLVETVYRFGSDGSPQVETKESFMRTPISECLLSIPDGECLLMVDINPSDSCPDPIRNDDGFPLRPCQYGYWFNDFERSLAKIGYGVIVDGFYDSSEIDIIKRFQRDHGLDPDGLVGPLTWRAALPSSVCAPAADVSGESTCSDDWNDDGVYGPGDVVPH